MCTNENFNDELKDDEGVIWTPQITKEMVVDAAKEGKIFSPKNNAPCDSIEADKC